MCECCKNVISCVKCIVLSVFLKKRRELCVRMEAKCNLPRVVDWSVYICPGGGTLDLCDAELIGTICSIVTSDAISSATDCWRIE